MEAEKVQWLIDNFKVRVWPGLTPDHLEFEVGFYPDKEMVEALGMIGREAKVGQKYCIQGQFNLRHRNGHHLFVDSSYVLHFFAEGYGRVVLFDMKVSAEKSMRPDKFTPYVAERTCYFLYINNDYHEYEKDDPAIEPELVLGALRAR